MATSAIVLVAGRGRRLGQLTERRPKCMLDVAGRPILARTLDSLAACGATDVTLVVGYRPEGIRGFVGSSYRGMNINFVYNERHSETNTAYSLWLARDSLRSDVLLLEGDIVFETAALRQVLGTAEGESVWAAIPVSAGRDEGIMLARVAGHVNEVRLVRDPGTRENRFTFKCAGIQLLTPELALALSAELDREVAASVHNSFADLVLGRALQGHAMRICSLHDFLWAEVDDEDDLRAADEMFSRPSVAASVSVGGHDA